MWQCIDLADMVSQSIHSICWAKEHNKIWSWRLGHEKDDSSKKLQSTTQQKLEEFVTDHLLIKPIAVPVLIEKANHNRENIYHS